MSTPTPITHASGGIVCYAQEGVGLVVSAAEHNHVYSDMQARAEAAEAACIAKDEYLNKITGIRWGWDGDCGAVQYAESALEVSPAETRSVIAGLREELTWNKELSSKLLTALRELERASSRCSQLGAQTGPQWLKLSGAILSARAALHVWPNLKAKAPQP